MNYDSIYLTNEEQRRFLEIASGDRISRNNPEEGALFQKGLVENRKFGFHGPDGKPSSVDPHTIVLSDLGRNYYAQYMNQRRRDRQEAFRQWLNAIIAILGILATVLGFFI